MSAADTASIAVVLFLAASVLGAVAWVLISDFVSKR